MVISRKAKSVVYAILAAVLIALSVYFQMKMHQAQELEHTYFQSNAYLFISATVFIGTAVYSFRSYTKYHKEHATDSLFLLLVGVAFMIASIFTIISYGGLEGTFTSSGYTAVNLNIVLMSLLPVPFWIRGLILSAARNEETHKRAGPALFICIVVVVLYLSCIAFGGMMRMIYSSDAPPLISESSNDDTEKSV